MRCVLYIKKSSKKFEGIMFRSFFNCWSVNLVSLSLGPSVEKSGQISGIRPCFDQLPFLLIQCNGQKTIIALFARYGKSVLDKVRKLSFGNLVHDIY